MYLEAVFLPPPPLFCASLHPFNITLIDLWRLFVGSRKSHYSKLFFSSDFIVPIVPLTRVFTADVKNTCLPLKQLLVTSCTFN